MSVSNMTPFGITVVDTETLQAMLPIAGTVSMFVQTVTFDAQLTVPTAVILYGITP